ncbi:unnamed protein product [Nippostrongylus brasiliensis]|uniref:C-type lectin domain-containing protein n=1 Tax=Nippostrongylus brasiliensis TaxID=27835 RepID=A0A0N4YEJ1_NIPBR|nr:unnamed protein product [Nippostrongylus brasiliensis]
MSPKEQVCVVRPPHLTGLGSQTSVLNPFRTSAPFQPLFLSSLALHAQPSDAQLHQIFSDLFGKDPSKDNDYQHWNDITCTENMRAYVCKKKALH